MGAYKFSVDFEYQIGFCIGYEYAMLTIRFPFFGIRISFSKYAKGINIFGKEF